MVIKNKPSSKMLYDLYWVDEFSMDYISELYNCHPTTIKVWLDEYDIPVRSMKESQNTSRVIERKRNAILGDKNPARRDDVRAKMVDNHWMKNVDFIDKKKCLLDQISERMGGDDHPMKDREFAKRHGKLMEGKNNPAKRLDVRKKIGKAKSGDKHHNWQGGISFYPYCPKFNDELKQQIRDQYNNCDYFSGLPDYICNQFKNGKVQKLAIHHIDYDKTQGCKGVGWKLVPLSRKNHAKTQPNRLFWTRLICYSLEYDKTYYNIKQIDIMETIGWKQTTEVILNTF